MPEDPSNYLHTISQPGLRHGPLDRLLRAAMREWIAEYRDDPKPRDALRNAAVDLVSLARDTDRPEFGAAAMTLAIMADCGPEAVRAGLYALLDTASRLGLDRQTWIPAAALREMSPDDGYCPTAETLADVLADVLGLDDPTASVDHTRRWTAQERAQVWAWARPMWNRLKPSPDIPAKPDLLK